ncbi:MAG: CMGC/DYRK/YAK protein kinase [Amphiamblys sp. WSBS2006]|nr:MAG: CMGC/DYRK/YAK protein kinase [Amphiamblys sp. WSBS2006]
MQRQTMEGWFGCAADVDTRRRDSFQENAQRPPTFVRLELQDHSGQMQPATFIRMGDAVAVGGSQKACSRDTTDYLLHRVTRGLLSLYRRHARGEEFSVYSVPREAFWGTRTYTGKLKQIKNGTFFRFGDTVSGGGNSYRMLSVYGEGAFGRVYRCLQLSPRRVVALKVSWSISGYRSQQLLEARAHAQLMEHPERHRKSIITLYDSFQNNGHVFLVLEPMYSTLMELIRQKKYFGFSACVVRRIARKLLHGLVLLRSEGIAHCDLKPENILFKSFDKRVFKISDFGSCCVSGNRRFSYIQSRFYRAPEVILGLPYGCAVDMWSLGCVLFELLVGQPLFPGRSSTEQLHLIVNTAGYPTPQMLARGEHIAGYFDRVDGMFGSRYLLKEVNARENPHRNMRRSIMCHNSAEILISLAETEGRRDLASFVSELLQMDQTRRINAKQALSHPFVAVRKDGGGDSSSEKDFSPPQSPSQDF